MHSGKGKEDGYLLGIFIPLELRRLYRFVFAVVVVDRLVVPND